MKRGFTLIELSIVLVIIGLLIGGILVAQSMIASVKINRLVSDLYQYEAAINLFKDRFRNYPGDSPYFIPPGAPDNKLAYGDTDGDGLEDMLVCNGTASNYEPFQFWAHLSQSDMLAKDYPAITLDSSWSVDCGGTHNQDDYYYGEHTAYTEFSDDRPVSSLGTKKWYIGVTKSSASKHLQLSFRIDPLDTLSLEKKMGAEKMVFSQNHIGLVNVGDLGVCFYMTSPFVSTSIDCIDENAEFGMMKYYIAP